MVNNLKRDADYVLSNIVETNDGYMVKKDCKVTIPFHFEDKKLFDKGINPQCIGYFPIIMGDKYAVMSVMTKIKFSSTGLLGKETIQGVPHYTLSFDAGSLFIISKEVFNQEELMFPIIDEFLIHGKIPWYMSYDDVGKFILTSKEYVGVQLLPSEEAGEVLASMLARSKENRSVYYRTTDTKSLPVYIPLDSALYGATNTVNRIIGSRFSDGVMSSLVMPTKTIENIESVLRV